MIFIKECLDERQMRALEEYQRASQEKKFAELQSKFERTWKEQEEEVNHALFWCNIFTFVSGVLFSFPDGFVPFVHHILWYSSGSKDQLNKFQN